MKKIVIVFGLAAIALAGVLFNQNSNSKSVVTLLTHDSFLLSDTVIADFEKSTGLDLQIVTAGDAGSLLASAVLASGNPSADVIFGIDNTLISKALDADIFEAYKSIAMSDRLANAEDTYNYLVTPIDYGDVCINYDKSLGDAAPTTLEDLASPALKAQTVLTDPAASSPGLAFMLATIAEYGDGWLEYWKRLKANEVKIVNSWSDAYYVEFSKGGGSGKYPIVLSYATSPAAEYVYATDPKPAEASTAAMQNGCYRQIEFAGILRGTENSAAAQKVIDWLLSPAVQQDIPLNMFVYPVGFEVEMPAEFTQFAPPAESPLVLDSDYVAANLNTWLAEWDAVMKN